MKAIFKTKTVFGIDKIYPVNEEAILLTKLTRKLTVDHTDIHLMEQLGYIVSVQ